jgi:hypothetical protein
VKSGSGAARYIRYLNGKAVASSALVLAAGVAGNDADATIAKARNRGIGRHMGELPSRKARQRDYRVGIPQSSTVSHLPETRVPGCLRLGDFPAVVAVAPQHCGAPETARRSFFEARSRRSVLDRFRIETVSPGMRLTRGVSFPGQSPTAKRGGGPDLVRTTGCKSWPRKRPTGHTQSS